jgi:glycerophosphoryl diester phosphodiesterase
VRRFGLLAGTALVVVLAGPVHAASADRAVVNESGDATVPAAVVGRATERPLVIAHRGASGYLPEHTLAAYDLAIRQGADFIEPDLVPTADGELVCRHESVLAMVRLDPAGEPVRAADGTFEVLEATTDVADRPLFRARFTIREVMGRRVGGWFTEDFTLAELRTLRTRERLPELRPASAAHDGRYGIPTLDEVIALVRAWESRGRMVGIYPETKAPTWFLRVARRADGTPLALDVSEMLAGKLAALGFTDSRRVYIQSFEIANLVALKQRIMPRFGFEVPLVQLLGDVSGASAWSVPADVAFHAARGDDLAVIYGPLASELGLGSATTYASLVSPTALVALAHRYASVIGPNKDQVLIRRRLPSGGSQLTGGVAGFVAAAHAAGLQVHPYTLRAEAVFTGVDEAGRALSFDDEAARLFATGVDAVFTDQPDLAVAARARVPAGAP